jgi:hypothetical protein
MKVQTRHCLAAALGLGILGAASAAQEEGLPVVTFQPRMGEPVRGLTAAQMQRFLDGRTEFDTILTIADGLGPVFNDSSCSQCHSNPTSGGASGTDVTRFGKAAAGPVPFDPLASLGGSLLQADTIDPVNCQEVVPPQADVVIKRITPHTFGAGLLEAVPDAQIQFNANNPHPSLPQAGVPRPVQPVEGGPVRLGRFGWKGGVATVLTFSADASLNEQGLTNRFFPTENAPNGNLATLAICDTVPDPEDFFDPVTGRSRIDRQTDFQRFLAPPPQTPRSGMTGEAIFDSVGCNACHRASFTTGFVGEVALSNQLIRPYGDFLLHDMGALGDGIVDGIATEKRMMTRALWGIAGRDTLLHDGRVTGGTFAGNIDAAVQEHGGDAAFSRASYNALSGTDRAALAAFLQSLGRAEFDFENDGDVDEFDWFFLEPEFTGPGGAITPDDVGAIADVDQDGDFDLRDWGVLQEAFTGQ